MPIAPSLLSQWHQGLALLWALCIPALGFAQAQGSGAQLSGVVYDSLNRRPLTGADVHLRRLGDVADSANIELTAVTNELGAFDFRDIASGSYVLGFFHVSLDSLGVAMPLRQVEVRSESPMRVDLAVPSHAGIITLLCGRSSVSDSTALLTGVVRDAKTGLPVQPSVVALQWDELVIGKAGLRGETQGITTPTRSDGWYAFCNVHVNSAMQLRAAHGADTSGAISADLVAREVVRRDIYVGPATRVARDSAIVWSGPAQLAGEVRGSDGRAIAGASVSLMRGDAVATTNSDGRFLLTGLPAGSQTLAVRALGFIPARATVHLMTGGARNNAQVSLTSLKAYLDTIRVTTTRVYSRDMNGFESRKRAGQGHFIDRAQIERRKATVPSDLLQMIPRVEVAQPGVGFFGKRIAFRRPFRKRVVPAGLVRRRRTLQGRGLGDRRTRESRPHRRDRSLHKARRRSSTVHKQHVGLRFYRGLAAQIAAAAASKPRRVVLT